MAFSNLTSDSGSKPSLVMSSRRFSLSSNRSTIFSPQSVGSVETRKSSCFFLPPICIFSMMRPSCGRRFSLMSSFAMILRREVIASFSLSGGFMIDCKNAVNTEADAEFFFVRLHVNVAGSALHGVGEHEVHELDDGSFVGRSFEFGQLHLLLFSLHFDVGGVAEVVHRLHDLLELFFFRSAVGLVDALDDGTFRSDDRLDVEAGHELDIVHRKDVGRIDHGDGERCTYAAERENLVALRGFVRDQLDDGGIDFEIGKINGGHTVLARQEVGDVLV